MSNSTWHWSLSLTLPDYSLFFTELCVVIHMPPKWEWITAELNLLAHFHYLQFLSVSTKVELTVQETLRTNVWAVIYGLSGTFLWVSVFSCWTLSCPLHQKSRLSVKVVGHSRSLHIASEILQEMEESQNHSMVWVGKDLTDHLVPTLLPWAGTPSTRPHCSKSHPLWPWTLPGRGHPQVLWATSSSASQLSQ